MKTQIDPTQPTHFLILGAGRFGGQALQGLLRAHPGARITIVDLRRLPDIPRSAGNRVRAVRADAVDFLAEHLSPETAADWIVPTVPEHVARAWLGRRLGERLIPLPVPETLFTRLPNPMAGPGGAVYASIADFRCPDRCPARSDHCTVTEKPRPMVLHRFLKGLCIAGLSPIVVESRQLLPGVGGYPGRDLLDILHDLETHPSEPRLLATACQCHGVMHAFNVRLES